MRIQPLDPTTLHDSTAARLADIHNAEIAAQRPRHARTNAAALLGEMLHTFDDRPYDGMWLAYDGDALVGYATLELSEWDDPDMAVALCHVHPEHLGNRAGTGLLTEQAATTKAANRNKMLTFAFADTPCERLLLQQGWTIGQRTSQRRIEPQRLDYDYIAGLAAEASTHAGDYEILSHDGPLPQEWLTDMQTLSESINDAPLDDLDVEPDTFPPERLAGSDQAMVRRQQRVYRLMARHKDSGEWAGHSVVCVDGLRPGVANQEDTTVIPAHRGHRLGMLLKARMLLWLHDVQPNLETIDTWNSDSNDHMIAVNERLGCTVINRGLVMQVRL